MCLSLRMFGEEKTKEEHRREEKKSIKAIILRVHLFNGILL